MGKGKKTNKMSASQKLDLFWEALENEKLSALREGLVNTAIEAHTRTKEEPQLTPIMVAAELGKARSLSTLLDWYERRKPLRPKGWIDLRDFEHGRTALHMACMHGHFQCVKFLLEKDANVGIKDSQGCTARDLAVKNKRKGVVDLIDEYLKPDSDEEEEGDGDGDKQDDGLTRTQRSKIKRKQKEAEERMGIGIGSASVQDGNSGSDGADLDPNHQQQGKTQTHLASSIKKKQDLAAEKGPKPIWPEVEKVVESVENLQALHEISVTRSSEEELEPAVSQNRDNHNIDPALWYLHTINRLLLELPKGVLTSLPGSGLKRLKGLQVLVLNNNSLESLPEEVGELQDLRVLECEFNEIQRLPESISGLPNLQTVNVANNKITSLAPLSKVKTLSVLNASRNRIKSLDDVAFGNWSTRLHELAISENEIKQFPPEIGKLSFLHSLEAEGNRLQTLPPEMGQLKKLKSLKLDGNRITDNKIKKYLQGGNKGLKDLWKYLEKNAARNGGGGGGGGGKKKGKKKSGVKTEPKSDDESEDGQQEEEEEGSNNDDNDDGEEGKDVGKVKNGGVKSSSHETADDDNDSDSSLDIGDDEI